MSQDKNLRYEFDDFSFDVKTETLYYRGVLLPLTRKARQVFLILVQSANRTVEKDEIYNQIWTDSFVEEANLTQYIYLLRKCLSGNSGGENSYIETISGQGYRFNASVSEVFVAEIDETGAAEPEVARITKTNGHLKSAGEQTEHNPVAENQFDRMEKLSEIDNFEPLIEKFKVASGNLQIVEKRNYPRRFGGAAAAAVLLIAAAFFFYRFYTAAPAEINQINSLAVLPFTIVGEETANDKLGLGMADAVITRLSKLQTIAVRPTSAVFRYTDRPATNSAGAGRELGVDSVLEGTVQHDEKTVRVSVRLIKVADGKTLWAENFNEKFSDIFSVQDLISEQVAETLSLKLNNQQESLLVSRETANAEAFQPYQPGNYFWNLRGKDDLQKAVVYFRKAAQLDPNYARAYAALAGTYAIARLL